ncbi:M23 family metallopeptidase [Treponema sp.]
MSIRQLHSIAVLLLLSIVVYAQETIHTVKKGDTLYALARSYGVSASEILAANGITDARKLQVGQKIQIPRPETKTTQTTAATTKIHRVVRGETLYGIAREYKISLSEVLKINGLTEKSLIKVGDSLRIPIPAEIAQEEAASKPSPTSSSNSSPDSSASPAAAPNKQLDPRQTVLKDLDPRVSWPIKAKSISYMTGKLRGVVIAGEKAEVVRSLSAGTVVSAGPYRGFGRVAIIQAQDGHAYVYGGCESLSVKEGDKVVPGATLGLLGLDALSGESSLFFLVYKDNIALDPAKAPRS